MLLKMVIDLFVELPFYVSETHTPNLVTIAIMYIMYIIFYLLVCLSIRLLLSCAGSLYLFDLYCGLCLFEVCFVY